jgi:uncharacterized protein YjcR
MNAAKLDKADIPVIRRLHQDGLSIYRIAEKYDVHPTTIYYIISGRTWSRIEGIA